MGCSSSIVDKESIQPTTQVAMQIKNKKEDINVIQLVSQLETALSSGDSAKFNSTIFELKQNQLQLSYNCQNPIKIFGQLLNLLSSPDIQGMSSQIKKCVAHTSQIFLQQVYKDNKDGQKIDQATKQSWNDQIWIVRNLLNKSEVESTELEFELQCIEAGVKVLSLGQLDIKSLVLDFSTQVYSAIQAATQSDFSQIKQLFSSVISQLGQFGVNKLNEAWYLTVMANNYTQMLIQKDHKLIESIVDQLNQQRVEWHIMYAALDIIENYLETQSSPSQTVISLLSKLSVFESGLNAWKIREKVAQICIRNSTTQNIVDSLNQIYLTMLIAEQNPKVRKSLENPDYIRKQKTKLQQCWEQTQKEKEEQCMINQNQQLLAIQQQVQNNQEGSQSLYTDILQEAEDQLLKIQNVSKLIEVKSSVLDTLQSNVDKQKRQLDDIQKQLSKVEKLVCGRSLKEIIHHIFQQYDQQCQDWEAKLSLYVPEKGVRERKDVDDVSAGLDVDNEVLDFFESDTKRVMLIQGGAGTGKTIYCQYLLSTLVASRQLIPIYITLPQLQNWQNQMIEETLLELKINEVEIQKLRDSQKQIVFIIDGYDEIGIFKNLYAANNLQNWNCKAIFTCRSTHLANEQQYFKYFSPPKSDRSLTFQEFILIPFDDNQINDFLERYVSKQCQSKDSKLVWNDWRMYRQQIDSIPGLQDLVENRVILSMVVSVLPVIVQKRESTQNVEKLIALDLYEEFTKQWFEVEEERMMTNNVSTSITNLTVEYQKFALDLADKMSDSVKTVVEYNSLDKQSEWRRFFDPNDAKITTIRRGIPLNSSGRFYSFIHKSILEYFASKAGMQQFGQLINKADTKCQVNTKMVSDIGVLKFYAENIQRYPEFKKLLFSIIELSKTDERVKIAAANAITMLNLANVHFVEIDFTNIKIPNANLGLAMLYNSNFSGADLTNVNFQSAWLENVKFDGANMAETNFGKKAEIFASSEINCLKFSKAGDLLAISTGNQKNDDIATVQIWNTQTHELLQTYDHDHNATGLCFSPDSEILLSCSLDRTIKAWSISDNKIIKVITTDDDMEKIEYTPDGKFFLCTCGKTVHIYDNQYNLVRKLEGHSDKVWTASFNNDGTQIVSGSQDTTLKIWNTYTGENVATLAGHKGSIYQAIFSPHNSIIVSTSGDKTIKIWQTDTKQLVKTLAGHTGRVCSIAFSPNSKYIVTGGRDGKIKQWNIKTGDLLNTIDAHIRSIPAVQFSADGKIFVSGSRDMCIKFWDTASSSLIKQINQTHISEIQSVMYSHDNSFIVSCSTDATVKIWNAQTGVLMKSLEGHTDILWRTAISFDDKFILSASEDKTVKLWSVLSGECVKTFVLNSIVYSVDYSKNGAEFAIGCADGTMQIFNTKSDKAIKVLSTPKPIHCVKYSEDGTLIAFAGKDPVVKLFEVKTGKIVKEFAGLSNTVKRMHFKNGNIYAKDKSLRIRGWNIQSGAEIDSKEISKDIFGVFNNTMTNEVIRFESCIKCSSCETKKMIWVAGQYTLQLVGCSIKNIQNLSDDNLKLFQQYIQ
ncbi:WD40_repeat protein [Hexamita inflata]|uniref:WD40 repeat protein n=1 Tax=Hexamita inflata TaxID=28002 RepID=A0AA86QK19_9EUKA|nr:WD40 repeat protein [Hexamita inflata]